MNIFIQTQLKPPNITFIIPSYLVKETSDNCYSDSVIVDNEASETISDTQLIDTSSSTNSEHTENTNLADTSSIRGLEFQRKGMHISNLNIRHLKSKRKAMNRNWYNQKANPALNTNAGNK